MNLSEWAAKVGVNKHTAYRWYREGKLPVPAQRVGRLILVTPPDEPATAGAFTAVYAHGNEDDLDRQVGRVTAWAAANGHTIDRVVTETGERRPQFARLLADATVGVVVVEHPDVLPSQGMRFVDAALKAAGRKIVVVDGASP